MERKRHPLVEKFIEVCQRNGKHYSQQIAVARAAEELEKAIIEYREEAER